MGFCFIISLFLFSLMSKFDVYLPQEGGGAEVSGSPTEKAILAWGIEVTP